MRGLMKLILMVSFLEISVACSTVIPAQKISFMPTDADPSTAVTIQFQGDIRIESINGKPSGIFSVPGLTPYTIELPEGVYKFVIEDREAYCTFEMPFYKENSPFKIWSEINNGGHGEFFLLESNAYSTNIISLKHYFTGDIESLLP